MQVRSDGKVFRSESEWHEIVTGFDSSGLSQVKYCEQHGISVKSFQRVRARNKTTSKNPASFIEIFSRGGGQIPHSGEYRVELELGSSMVLRIR